MKSVARVECSRFSAAAALPLRPYVDSSAAGALAADHAREFPDQILHPLHGAVSATRTERRYLVRRIADEQHAAVHESIEFAAAERVGARPFEIPVRICAEHRVDARADVLHAQR